VNGRRPLRLLAALVGLSWAAPALADSVSVAVAANFTAPAQALAKDFTARTGHELVLSFGATGGLYTQITQGAPFQVLLAADDERPARAVREGYGVAGSVFTYAIGRLALYSTVMALGDGAAVLREGAFTRLSIANPQTAPYGAAGLEVLGALDLTQALTPKLVTGESIAQTLQFVETGNAELGFVALSQVIAAPAGAVWLVPETLHAPLAQDGVLLDPQAPAARAFLDYLRSAQAQAIMSRFGYQVP